MSENILGKSLTWWARGFRQVLLFPFIVLKFNVTSSLSKLQFWGF